MKTPKEIQNDFDRIARAEPAGEAWNHNNHYHGFLLRHAPRRCANALEIGCGRGAFARLLAQRSDHVVGIDLSPEMLRIAREQSSGYHNIEYVQADVMTLDLLPNHFDCIASIATLHHLSLDAVLPRLKAALKPGGVLLVLDLFQSEGFGDLLQNIAAIPLHVIMKAIRGGHGASVEAQAAWDAHGSHDVYLTMDEVRRACAHLLPGAEVRRHLLWRYSIVWMKQT
jgi:ubiquinone/menaquinone biosynthesis C-methylase UbiE